jgi:hypothetical protein
MEDLDFKPAPTVDSEYVQQFGALDEESYVAVAEFLGVDPTDLGAYREINASGKGFGDAWMAVLCQHLICNPRITAFDGSFNKVGDAGCEALADMFGNQHCMETLMLSENYITNDGVASLFQAIPFSNTLITLDLSLNSIDADGCKAIATALVHTHVLQILDLSVNRIGDAGCEELATALEQNDNLRALFLRLNQIGDVGMQALARALRVNQGLQELALCDNNVGTEGVVRFAQALEHNQFLGTLRTAHCTLTLMLHHASYLHPSYPLTRSLKTLLTRSLKTLFTRSLKTLFTRAPHTLSTRPSSQPGLTSATTRSPRGGSLHSGTKYLYLQYNM